MIDRIEYFLIDNLPAYAYIPYEFALKNNINTGYIGPRNLKWRKLVNFDTPLQYFSEKNRKKVFKAKEYSINELGYQYQLNKIIKHEDFTEWLILYNKNIEKKEMGIIRINEEWFEKTQNSNKYGSIFIKDANNKIIAGAIVNIDRVSNEISCDYRAHEYLKIKDSSLSALVEMCLDEYAINGRYKTIRRGTDENLYGIRLNLGLMEFKKYYNFTPFALDHNSNYYKRVLVFFREYKNIVTYEYSDDGVNLIQNKIETTKLTPLEDILKIV